MARLICFLVLVGVIGCSPQPQSISVGETITATLSSDDPALSDGSRYHLYQLQTTAGEIVTITQRSEEVDSYLLVSTDSEFVVADFQNDDFELISRDAQISFVGNGQTYYILANTYDEDDFGSYDLSVDNVAALATIHLNGASTVTTQLTSDALELEDGSYYHCYALDTQPGTEYMVSLTSPDFYTYLMVASGDYCGENILYSTDDAPSITFTAESDSYYAITNALQPGDEGVYTLTIGSE